MSATVVVELLLTVIWITVTVKDNTICLADREVVHGVVVLMNQFVRKLAELTVISKIQYQYVVQ